MLEVAGSSRTVLLRPFLNRSFAREPRRLNLLFVQLIERERDRIAGAQPHFLLPMLIHFVVVFCVLSFTFSTTFSEVHID